MRQFCVHYYLCGEAHEWVSGSDEGDARRRFLCGRSSNVFIITVTEGAG